MTELHFTGDTFLSEEGAAPVLLKKLSSAAMLAWCLVASSLLMSQPRPEGASSPFWKFSVCAEQKGMEQRGLLDVTALRKATICLLVFTPAAGALPLPPLGRFSPVVGVAISPSVGVTAPPGVGVACIPCFVGVAASHSMGVTCISRCGCGRISCFMGVACISRSGRGLHHGGGRVCPQQRSCGPDAHAPTPSSPCRSPSPRRDGIWRRGRWLGEATEGVGWG